MLHYLRKSRTTVITTCLIFILVLMCSFMAVSDKLISGLDFNRYRVQKLLGILLPESADDIRYHKDQPNWAWNYYTVYIRLSIPENEYMDLMQQMEMNFYTDATTPYSYLFPGKWKTPSHLTLDWWKPTLETPKNNAATRQYGSATLPHGSPGWIIAKHEHGYAYIQVFVPSEAE